MAARPPSVRRCALNRDKYCKCVVEFNLTIIIITCMSHSLYFVHPLRDLTGESVAIDPSPPPSPLPQHVLAEVWVVPAAEVGTSERQTHCRTHLGHILAAGDLVLGFDVSRANVNDPNLSKMKATDIPDVVSGRYSPPTFAPPSLPPPPGRSW